MIWLVKTRDQIPAKEREVLLKKLQQRKQRLKQKYPRKLKQGKLLTRRTREIIKLKLATRRKKKICQAT